MIEFLVNSLDLIRVILGILSGFFIGIWFSLSMMTWFERNPYRIVDPQPEQRYEDPEHDPKRKYYWTTPSSFRNPSGGD